MKQRYVQPYSPVWSIHRAVNLSDRTRRFGIEFAARRHFAAYLHQIVQGLIRQRLGGWIAACRQLADAADGSIQQPIVRSAASFLDCVFHGPPVDLLKK